MACGVSAGSAFRFIAPAPQLSTIPGSALLCVYATFLLLAGDQRRWPGTVWLTLGICAIPLADRLEARRSLRCLTRSGPRQDNASAASSQGPSRGDASCHPQLHEWLPHTDFGTGT